MICKYCEMPMKADHDPYGTGDHWFVLYEPQCDCELHLERQDSIATLKQAVLENHNDYINKLKQAVIDNHNQDIKTLEEKTK